MARKAPSFLASGQKEFIKQFSALCDRHSSWQVWADFVEIVAISISNTVDRTNIGIKREKRYLEIIERYRPEEQKVFPQLMETLVNALDEKQDQDFLGDLFMSLELGSHWKGQFFTPYNICKFTAEIQCNDAPEKIKERGWISINDPACGAGALLIAARNAFARDGIGSDRVLFVAQDIDRVAGLMCYIQLSLLGCAGYVVIADTLCNPLLGSNPIFPVLNENHDAWFTPMWYSNPWVIRRFLYRNYGIEECKLEDTAKTCAGVRTTTAEAQKNVDQLPTNCQKLKIQKPPEESAGEQLRLF